jgi:hypothetical protein
MRDSTIWRQELIDEVRTLADRHKLERLWSGSDPCAISSFAEEVAHVFDDYDIDAFLKIALRNNLLSGSQLQALHAFRDVFSAFVDRFGNQRLTDVSARRVLDDPRWLDVMSAARNFVNLTDEGT